MESRARPDVSAAAGRMTRSLAEARPSPQVRATNERKESRLTGMRRRVRGRMAGPSLVGLALIVAAGGWLWPRAAANVASTAGVTATATPVASGAAMFRADAARTGVYAGEVPA